MMANRLKIMCNIGGDDCVAAKDLCVSACHKDFLQSHFVGKWGLGLPEKPLLNHGRADVLSGTHDLPKI